MNKIFKVVYSKARNCYVVASEFARVNGKSKSGASVAAKAALAVALGLMISFSGTVTSEATLNTVGAAGENIQFFTNTTDDVDALNGLIAEKDKLDNAAKVAGDGNVNAGSGTFTDTVSMQKNLNVTGTTTSGTLSVTGNASFMQGLSAMGDISTTGDVSGKDGTFTGDVSVTGDVSGKDGTFTGDLKGKTVTSDTTINAGTNITAGGDISTTNGTISGKTVAATDVNATNVTVTGNLNASNMNLDKITVGTGNNKTTIDGGNVKSVNYGTDTGTLGDIKSSSEFTATKDEVIIRGDTEGTLTKSTQEAGKITNDVEDLQGNSLNKEERTKESTTSTITNADKSKSSVVTQKIDEAKTEITDGTNTSTFDQKANETKSTVSGDGKTTTITQGTENVSINAENGKISNTAQNLENTATTGSITNTASKGTITNTAKDLVNTATGTKTENITGAVTEEYGSQSTKVNGAQSNTVTGTKTEEVDGKVTETYKAGQETTVTGEQKNTVNGTKTESVTGDVTEDYQAGLSTTVGGDETHKVGGALTEEYGSQSTKVKGEKSEEVDGKVTETYKAGQETTVTGEQKNTVDGTKTESVTGDVTEDYQAGLSTTVGGDETHKVGGALTEEYGSQSTKVKGEKSEEVTGKVTETYSAGQETTVTGERKETVSGAVTEEYGSQSTKVNGAQSNTVTGTKTENVTGKVTETYSAGQETTITGDRKLTVSGNIENTAASIKNVTGANTVTSSTDGTTFENTGANTPIEDGSITKTIIKGNTVETGKVTADYIDVNKDLDVKGDTKLEGDAEVGKNLTVKGTSNLKDTNVDGALDVTGATKLHDTLEVSGESNFKGPATFDEVAAFNKGLDAKNNKVTGVANGEISATSKDAINGSQIYGMNQQIDQNTSDIVKTNGRLKRVGAGAAALANLHPLEFDPDSKLNVAAAVGNYRNETATALGLFARPNENVMINISATLGQGDDNMVGGGVSVRLGHGGNKARRAKLDKEEARIKELESRVDVLNTQLDAFLSVLNPKMSKDFPDVPENHWAYEAVSKLAGNDLIQGDPDGKFHGERRMSRYEMAQIIYNALKKGAKAEQKLVEEFRPELKALLAKEQ